MELMMVVGAARSATQLAQAVGILEDRTQAALAAVHAEVRAVHEAPLREGLRRLRQASLADSDVRRSMLLEEARGKLEDAAARDLDPTVHATALYLLGQTWLLLGERGLAAGVAREALLAADSAYEAAHYVWSTGPMIPLPWRPLQAKPDPQRFLGLAGDAADLALALGVDVEPLLFWDDQDDDWEAPDDFDYDTVLTWLNRPFMESRRKRHDRERARLLRQVSGLVKAAAAARSFSCDEAGRAASAWRRDASPPGSARSGPARGSPH